MQTTLSIIIVTKNDLIRLDKTLNSLYYFYNDPRFEIIIIDGASIDGTINFLNKFNKITNIKILSENDNGIYDAMNKGILVSTGKYLNFLNCGDLFLAHPDNLYMSFEPFFNRNNFDILCYEYEEEYSQIVKKKYPKLNISYKLPCSHQAMIFLSNLNKSNLYNTKYKIASDYDLYSKISMSRVLASKSKISLVRIEKFGYASNNFLLAYKEYINISLKNFYGFERIKNIFIILIKAFVIVAFKIVTSKKIYNSIRARYN